MVRTELRAYLVKLFSQTSIALSAENAERFTRLIELLVHWNKALNLTAIKDEKEMALLHILDSAVLSPLLLPAEKRIADVGTGAGFPGLVLAALNPDKDFTLIDSVGKKLSFVQSAALELRLSNVKIIHGRVEQIKADPGFAVIVSRAFAPLERMAGWCLPLLAPQGRFIAMKAHLSPEELKAVPPTVKIDRIETLQVPTLAALRQAVVLTRV